MDMGQALRELLIVLSASVFVHACVCYTFCALFVTV